MDAANLGDLSGPPSLPRRRSSTAASGRTRRRCPTVRSSNGQRHRTRPARAGSRARRARGDRPANRGEFVAAYLGIMRAGLVAVPLNHKLPRATLELVLEDCAPRLGCTTPTEVPIPPGIAGWSFGTQWAALQDAGPFTPVPGARAGDDLYTSGSSGRPKGVVLTHEGHLWAVRMRLRGGSHDHHRLLIAAPLFHMNGLDAWARLAAGARGAPAAVRDAPASRRSSVSAAPGSPRCRRCSR